MLNLYYYYFIIFYYNFKIFKIIVNIYILHSVYKYL